jgi:hypothetical protein
MSDIQRELGVDRGRLVSIVKYFCRQWALCGRLLLHSLFAG